MIFCCLSIADLVKELIIFNGVLNYNFRKNKIVYIVLTIQLHLMVGFLGNLYVEEKYKSILIFFVVLSHNFITENYQCFFLNVYNIIHDSLSV